MRCQEFYERWTTDPNWCERCKSSVSNINKYIAITRKLDDAGADKQLTYVKLSENTVRFFRGIPEETLDKMIPPIAVLINSPQVVKIDEGQLRSIEIQMQNDPKKRRKITKKLHREYPIKMPFKIIGQKDLERNIARHIQQIKTIKENIRMLEEELTGLREQLNKIIKSELENTNRTLPKKRKPHQ